MSYSIEKLIKSGNTVFNIQDLSLLWGNISEANLKAKIYYLTQKSKLIRLSQGIFALDSNYNKFELSAKLKNPSYISLETVLRLEGVVFQYSSEISAVSNLNRNYFCDNIEFTYHKFKDAALFNQEGLIQEQNYVIASKERAFLDMMYLNKDYYFDNLRSINWDKCDQLVKIYNNSALIKRYNNYRKKYAG